MSPPVRGGRGKRPPAMAHQLVYLSLIHISGTGDTFMSMVVGHYMKSGRLSESVRIAMNQLEKIIRLNMDYTDKYKGIPIELRCV